LSETTQGFGRASSTSGGIHPNGVVYFLQPDALYGVEKGRPHETYLIEAVPESNKNENAVTRK